MSNEIDFEELKRELQDAVNETFSKEEMESIRLDAVSSDGKEIVTEAAETSQAENVDFEDVFVDATAEDVPEEAENDLFTELSEALAEAENAAAGTGNAAESMADVAEAADAAEDETASEESLAEEMREALEAMEEAEPETLKEDDSASVENAAESSAGDGFGNGQESEDPAAADTEEIAERIAEQTAAEVSEEQEVLSEEEDTEAIFRAEAEEAMQTVTEEEAARAEAEAAKAAEEAAKAAEEAERAAEEAAEETAAEEDALAKDVAEALEDDIPPAYDMEALTAAVMASQERASREAEQQILDEASKERRRKRRARTFKKLGITFVVLAIMAGIGAGVYYYMASYYRTHFLTGTTVNGKDVSKQTAAEVKRELLVGADDYTLTIVERDGRTEEITSEMLGQSYVDNDQVEQILAAQDSARWIFFLNEAKDYTVSFETTYDKTLARRAVDNLSCFTSAAITLPQDARLSADTDGKYIIIPEVEGNKLDEGKAKELILAAIANHEETVDLEAADLYLKPAVTSEDERLNKRMNAWNAYLSVDVVYHFGPNEEVINAETVRPYITDNGYDVSIATDWVRTLVYGWGQKYDTFGLERKFTTHDGITINIPAGGDYGWCIDKEKTIEDVRQCINEGLTGEREPIWLFSAMGWDNDDITGTYVEVSIPEQHLWCYKDGVLVIDTDVVTGLPTDTRQTFPGCFAIDGKKTEATLGRLDVQGYESPVSFWLPFNGGEGLHDAPWRTQFGGDIYLYNGSHGCVNIPEENMEAIFNTMEIGMAVIVYNDKTPAM